MAPGLRVSIALPEELTSPQLHEAAYEITCNYSSRRADASDFHRHLRAWADTLIQKDRHAIKK